MSKTKDKKKLLVKRQRNVGTTKMQKEKRGRRINKELLELEAKYDALKKSHTKLVDACRAGGIELEFCHSRTKRLLDTKAMIEQALEEAEKL